MQQIERYGVIALVFLLVTIVAVSFWGDNKSPGFWSRLTGSKTAVVAEDKNMTPPPSNGELTHTTALPIGGDGAQPETLPEVAGAEGASTTAAASELPVAQQQPTPAGLMVESPAAQPDLAPKTNGTIYVVKSGDSPARIAKRQLGSESRVNEILALNPGLNPKNLKVGQELLLPTGAAPAAAEPVAAAAKPASQPVDKSASLPATKPVVTAVQKASSKGGRSYKVQKGDTLSAIARRELGSAGRAGEIQALNPGLDPAKLKVGQSITLPGGSAAVAANVEPKRRIQ